MYTQQREKSNVVVLIRYIIFRDVIKDDRKIKKCGTDQAADKDSRYFLQF